ncbi:MAG: lipoate--protein ligase family protein [Lachnospiraceae bacterium]|nr:lipoate--protein ligase family protein [Lachnospiraceae bacterium]
MTRSAGKPIFICRTTRRDPYFNLALEQTLLDHPDLPPLVLLWQNDPAVVVGRHQSVAQELDPELARSLGIAIVRRPTGGGAVYHDSGNVNYSFILNADDTSCLTDGTFSGTLAYALSKMGLPACLSARNDLLVTGPDGSRRKICGTAEMERNGRLLHHGCLLFDTDLETLTRILTPSAEKLASHGIDSVRSRVTNIRPLLPRDMTTEAFISALQSALSDVLEATILPQDEPGVDLREPEQHRQKLASEAWIYRR